MVRSSPFIALSDSLALVPSVRGHVVFASEVRRAVSSFEPDCIAVEFPRGLKGEFLEMIADLPRIDLLAYRTSGGNSLYLVADPGDAAVEACRLALERQLPLEFLDDAEGERDEVQPDLPDPEAVAKLGLELYAQPCLDALRESVPSERDLQVARRVLLLGERHSRTLLVLSFATSSALVRMMRGGVPRGKLHSDESILETNRVTLPPIMLGHAVREMADTIVRYETWRLGAQLGVSFPTTGSRWALLRSAARAYEQRFSHKLSRTEWRTLLQFARHLALVRDRIVPGFYELVTAAQACIDDDFGAMVFARAAAYPPNGGDVLEEDPPEAVEAEPEEFEPDAEGDAEPDEDDEDDEGESGPHSSNSLYADFSGETARIAPTYYVGKTRQTFFHFKRRRMTPGEIGEAWERILKQGGFEGSSICSWPPEDSRIESFLRQVALRALERLGESRRHVEAFSTSFLDGIDVRETVRRWNESKVYVRRERGPKGRIGPVVVVWEDDPLLTRGQWRTTLYAEHQNESDISIVCFPPPGVNIVGPGISRLEYRSLMSVYPARYIPDIWQDPTFISMWKTHGRAQIAAALLLSEAPHIAVVSALPPDSELRALARTVKVDIIHLPLTAFPSTLMDRVRTLHILADKEIRRWAEHYIPK